jgi:DNA repair protein RecN (Recombination protein N)
MDENLARTHETRSSATDFKSKEEDRRVIESLHIKNLALVPELEVEFGPGLNVVTGETGAGKSLILGALQLLLGGRADKSLIRRGASACEISAIFCLAAAPETLREEVSRLLEETGVAGDDDGRLLFRRVITASASRCYVNGSAVPLALLRQLGDCLVDIHGPNEHQSLFHLRTQLALLDGYAGLEKPVAECRLAWDAWKSAEQRLAAAQSETLSERELEFAKFQLQEIEKAGLVPGEEVEVIARHKVAAAATRLIELASQCGRGLGDGDDCAADQLGRFVGAFEELATLDPAGAGEFQGRIETIIESLRELAGDLEHYAGKIDADPEELARLDERLEVIQRMKRRYGGSVEAALALAEELRTKVSDAENRETRLQELARDLTGKERQYQAICEKLAKARKNGAGRLGPEIAAKLQRLGFLQARFEVAIRNAVPSSQGTDEVEFCFAPNPGEGMQPLRKVASSGELARVMLAVKTVLSEADSVPVLFFDEVDANIGGRVAIEVSREMRALGQHHQVFSISHLAQIAAAADRHYLVDKQVEGDRTVAGMVQVEGKERERELMRMLGAAEESQAARRHVREMLHEVRA